MVGLRREGAKGNDEPAGVQATLHALAPAVEVFRQVHVDRDLDRLDPTDQAGFLHAVAVIMAAQSYWQGKRLYYDSAAEQITDSPPAH